MKSLETRFVESYSELESQLANLSHRRIDICAISPYQFVFGATPRLLADLLSDDPTDAVGLSDRQQDAVAADGVAASFARQHEIRQEARRFLFSLGARRKPLKRVAQQSTVTRTFHRHGSAVKRGRLKDHAVFQDRMRTRLWTRSTEQLRPATHPGRRDSGPLDKDIEVLVQTCGPREGVQRDESGVSLAQSGLNPDAPMTALGNQTVLDPPWSSSTEGDTINPGAEETG